MDFGDTQKRFANTSFKLDKSECLCVCVFIHIQLHRCRMYAVVRKLDLTRDVSTMKPERVQKIENVTPLIAHKIYTGCKEKKGFLER